MCAKLALESTRIIDIAALIVFYMAGAHFEQLAPVFAKHAPLTESLVVPFGLAAKLYRLSNFTRSV